MNANATTMAASTCKPAVNGSYIRFRISSDRIDMLTASDLCAARANDLLPGAGHPHMNRRDLIKLLGGAAARGRQRGDVCEARLRIRYPSFTLM
jgi:hypothetical protein